MKKTLAMLFVVLALFLLCACRAEEPVKVAPVSAQIKEAPTISSFLRDLLDYKALLWKQVEQKYSGTAYAGDFPGINAPDYFIALFSMFDTLTLVSPDANRREGKLMVSGLPAWSELNGSLLRFGFSYTYAEDAGAYKKGSVEEAKGELDFEKNTLLYEDTVQAEGQMVARTVIEVVRTEGGYAYQYLFAGGKKGSVDAVFTTLSAESFAALCATKKDGLDFSYRSIRFGKTALAYMSEGFDVNMTVAATTSGARIEKK